MVRSPSLPLPILVRTFLQSLPRIHKQKKVLWRLCVLGCHLTLLSRSWQLPPELQNALYSCCDTSRSHPGTEVPCSLILPLCLARLSSCPGGCQEKVLCVLLRHGPPRASRRGQPEDGKHFEQVSDVKRCSGKPSPPHRLSSSAPALPSRLLSAGLTKRNALTLLIQQTRSTFQDTGGKLGAINISDKSGCQWKVVFYQTLHIIA